MKTLMRTVETSIGKPGMGHARKERVVLFGTDQRITSGPAAMAAASRRRQSSKRKQAGYMTAPERFAKRSDSFPLHRGRRPYMTQLGSGVCIAAVEDGKGRPRYTR